jgi:GT2 family glycosyltransferase
MISIITAVHNGLAFNRLYAESLKKYTRSDYELIIIDNNSTDGSREFFQQHGAVVIASDKNYSYPVCQNKGIEAAKGDHLFFLNNDIIVSPWWDERLIQISAMHGVDIISGCGIENMGDFYVTRKFQRKWKRAKNLLIPLGFGRVNLQVMRRLMYGNWEKFCETQFEKSGNSIVEGILGNNVMMTRRAIQLTGMWDERIQAADFDLFMRVKKRSMEVGDIKPCQISLGVYVHHYIRMTSKYAVKPVPFTDRSNLIDLTAKWPAQELEALHPDNASLRIKTN